MLRCTSILASTYLAVTFVGILLMIVGCPASDVKRLVPLPYGKRESNGKRGGEIIDNSNSSGAPFRTQRRTNSLDNDNLTTRDVQLYHDVEEEVQNRDESDWTEDMEARHYHHRHHHKSHKKHHKANRNEKHKGRATYYKTSGTGACGKRDNNGEKIVALSTDMFKEHHCGQTIKVCRTTKKKGTKCVDVTVEDECPECSKTSLDLTLVAFESIAPKDEGDVGVSWHFV